MKPKTIAFAILAVFAFLVTALWARAVDSTVTFEWDPNPTDEEVVGYTFRTWPASGGVGYVKTVGNTTRVSVAIPPSGVWFATVEAFSSHGMTSEPSMQLRYSFPSRPGEPRIVSVATVTTITTVSNWISIP